MKALCKKCLIFTLSFLCFVCVVAVCLSFAFIGDLSFNSWLLHAMYVLVGSSFTILIVTPFIFALQLLRISSNPVTAQRQPAIEIAELRGSDSIPTVQGIPTVNLAGSFQSAEGVD